MEGLYQFSAPEPACFVSVTRDNRIKIWDVATNSLIVELIEKNHLTAGYSCLTWHAKVKGAGKHGAVKQSRLGSLGLGTSRGAVVVWDVKKGEIATTCGESGKGHASEVRAVAFSHSGSWIASCSSDKKVFIWDAHTGELVKKLRGDKFGGSQIAFTPDDTKLVVVGTKFVVLDIESGSRLAKFDAHSSAAGCLAMFPTGSHAASCGADRFVSVWPLTSGDEATVEAARTLICSSKPMALRVQPVDTASRFRMLATCADGQCRLWQFGLDGSKAKKPLQPGGALKPSHADWPVVAAVFSSVSDVTVAQGNAIRPMFQTVSVEDGDSLKAEVPLPAFGSGLLAPTTTSDDKAATASKKVNGVHVVGPGQQGSARSTLDASQADPSLVKAKAEDGKKKRRRTGEGEDTTEEFSDPDMADFAEFERMMDAGGFEGSDDEGLDGAEGTDDDEDGEDTLRERLTKLRAALGEGDEEDETAKSGAGKDDAEKDDESLDAGSRKKLAAAERARIAELLKSDVPKAQSLSTLLIQALQTNDKIQFEACLGVTDQKIIEDTVARLPLGRVVPFLAKVIGKFESSPSRGVTLTRWIRAVLTQHTAHLMSAPDLVRQLSGLYQMIDSRLNVFKPLLKLSGRLDLVLAQVAIRGAGYSKTKPASIPRQAFIADEGIASDEEGLLEEVDVDQDDGADHSSDDDKEDNIMEDSDEYDDE